MAGSCRNQLERLQIRVFGQGAMHLEPESDADAWPTQAQHACLFYGASNRRSQKGLKHYSNFVSMYTVYFYSLVGAQSSHNYEYGYINTSIVDIHSATQVNIIIQQ